ncbi:NAD-dependent dehydratase, partial [Escherichia coli]|nr:NAD-dependent dehydratase [Escherichia coli]
AVSRETLDMPGPEAVTMAQTVRLYRGWMGLRPAPVVRVPRALAAPALAIGDLLGRLGWSSPIRTTAIKQMDHDVSGHDSDWAERLG